VANKPGVSADAGAMSIEKLRQADLGTRMREQLYSKLQTYLRLLKHYEGSHGQTGRIALEKDIKKLEAEGKTRGQALEMLAKVHGLESPPQKTTEALEKSTQVPVPKQVAVVEISPEEEDSPEATEDPSEEVRVISPVKEETLTPPRKAEPVKKSRQGWRPVVRPRPTEVPILAALSAVNGVMCFAAAWILSQDPNLGLPFLELFTKPGALIPTESYLPLLELVSLVFCTVFLVSTGFTVAGKRWGWNLMFVSTAAWMVVMSVTAAFVSAVVINVAVATLIVSAVSFYYMTSDPVKDFFKA